MPGARADEGSTRRPGLPLTRGSDGRACRPGRRGRGRRAVARAPPTPRAAFRARLLAPAMRRGMCSSRCRRPSHGGRGTGGTTPPPRNASRCLPSPSSTQLRSAPAHDRARVSNRVVDAPASRWLGRRTASSIPAGRAGFGEHARRMDSGSSLSPTGQVDLPADTRKSQERRSSTHVEVCLDWATVRHSREWPRRSSATARPLRHTFERAGHRVPLRLRRMRHEVGPDREAVEVARAGTRGPRRGRAHDRLLVHVEARVDQARDARELLVLRAGCRSSPG